jgi:hypothetical protein
LRMVYGGVCEMTGGECDGRIDRNIRYSCDVCREEGTDKPARKRVSAPDAAGYVNVCADHVSAVRGRVIETL